MKLELGGESAWCVVGEDKVVDILSLKGLGVIRMGCVGEGRA